MSLLSRILGRGDPEKPIDQMSFAEIAALIASTKDDMLARDLISVARRLTDIAVFDHGVSDQERVMAFELLPALDADIEVGLKDQPGAWEAYQEAIAAHRGQARYYGYGSLQWIMDERGTTAAEVIPFIALEEHAELLPAYLEMMEPDVIYSVRGELIGELCRSRARGGERPIDVLSRLATDGDGALTLLLDGRQLGAISRAHVDPEAAEAVLVELGIEI